MKRSEPVPIPEKPSSPSPLKCEEKNDHNGEEIPETVLQYERQMRKIRAADKAGAPVSKEKHLKVIFLDDDIVVTDKPSGILCVPGVNHNPSLLGLVHEQFSSSAPEDSKMKRDTMIVHRLDMDTSGLVIFGRTMRAVSKLHEFFRKKQVDKRYEALVCGHVKPDEGLIDLPLQRDHERPPFMRVSTPSSEAAAAKVVEDLQHHGWKKIMKKKPKPSQTEFTVIERTVLPQTDLPVTRLSLNPITGRTHQLRVHCAAMGHPIVADPTYGIYGESSANGGFSEAVMDTIAPSRASIKLQKEINVLLEQGKNMCLHAKKLEIKHPINGEKMTWEAPTPF